MYFAAKLKAQVVPDLKETSKKKRKRKNYAFMYAYTVKSVYGKSTKNELKILLLYNILLILVIVTFQYALFAGTSFRRQIFG